MDYVMELFDAQGVRRARFHETPLLEVWRRGPDESDTIRGLLPQWVEGFSPGWRVRVAAGALAVEATVQNIAPEWSDARKLILGDYVPMTEVLAFEAESDAVRGNGVVSRVYDSEAIDAILRDAVDAALGDLHYYVEHGDYPDGAEREHAKFLARKAASDSLPIGGIHSGQWVGGVRVDASAAYAKDGDTIAGLVVDGAPWPDVRLLMVDCEETSRNSHAMKRHPEVAEWDNARYDRSGYNLRADAAKAALQALIDAHGIDHLELNPHRDSLGNYDDRVDAYGRYIALVYGGGQCFNAALVELAHADVYNYAGGAYHVPEMALKDFYSYSAPHADSIESAPAIFETLDARGGALEVATMLAYAAGGYVFQVDADLGLRFRKAETPDRVLFFDPETMGVRAGANVAGMGNYLIVRGHPLEGHADGTYWRSESMDRFGVQARVLEYFGLFEPDDAEQLAEGMLDDLAYPERAMELSFYRGDPHLKPGDIVELRGAPVRRQDAPCDGEFGGAFAGKTVGRVHAVRLKITGRYLETTALLGSPLRSVRSPLSFIVRSQEPALTHFQFRLDDATIGLDEAFHLD